MSAPSRRWAAGSLGVLAIGTLALGVLAIGALPAQDSGPGSGPESGRRPTEVERRLAGWLAVQDQRDEQDAAYARYRRAFAAGRPPAWLPPLEPAMRTFGDALPVRCDAVAVDRLCAEARARVQRGAGVHELLPWLLAVARQQPDDLRLPFWTAHALGLPSPVCDPAAAVAPWQVIADALADGADVTASVPEGAAWLLPHWRDLGQRLAAGRPLRWDWLARARHRQRDRAFAAAVASGHRERLEQQARAMVRGDPGDAAAQLLLAMVLMSRGADRRAEAERCAREFVRLRDGSGDQGAAIDARLQHLGVLDACRACGLDVAAPLRWFDDVHRQRLRCAFPDFDALTTVCAGLRRKIERAEEHVASGQELWQHHHDKQQDCLDKARIADRRTRKTWWRKQAAREEAKKDVHARAIAGKRETIRRYQDQIDAFERAMQRMRSFTLGG